MRSMIPILAFLALLLAATHAQAASCSSFAVIRKYDPDGSRVKVSYKKGKVNKYFPRPEGTPTDSLKVPGACKRKVTKQSTLKVKSSGGRLSMTQVRSNFEGKMLNDASDDGWLGNKLRELIQNKTEVVIVVRPGVGKDAPLGITTIYMPITADEEAEIARLEAQAEELE